MGSNDLFSCHSEQFVSVGLTRKAEMFLFLKKVKCSVFLLFYSLMAKCFVFHYLYCNDEKNVCTYSV